MDEIKKMLRSILVSSPLTITVIKLNNDYRELVGHNIPFNNLGYDNVIAFLRAMPDVLVVRGNTLHSPVELIVSAKTAHVNDMVLKQKVNNKRRPGAFFSSKRTKRYSPPPRMTPNRIPSQKPPQLSSTPAPFPNNTPSPLSNSCHSQNISNSDISKCTTPAKSVIHNNDTSRQQSNTPTNINSTNNNRSHSKVLNTHIKDPLQLDLKLVDSGEVKLKTESVKNGDTHYLRKLDYKNEKSPANSPDESRIPSLFEVELDMKITELGKEGFLKKDSTDFMRQLLLQKETLAAPPPKNFVCGRTAQLDKFKDFKEQKYEDIGVPEYSKIPSNIQDNLRQLISNFPEGLWCSQLPNEYKKLFRRELDYEDLGFRCLINMCMDLENIFHCSKESSCDFKLYDVRKPVPQARILQDQHPEDLSNNSKSNATSDSALPSLDWNSFKLLIPEDAFPLGVEIPRDSIDDDTKIGTIFTMVVAEIYDLSKFWMYRDTGELDCLMDDMQDFYKANGDKYLVPNYMLDVGFYCVVVTLNEFHRALILSIPPSESFVKVYFIDYGSLGKAPKNEVWFLTKNFSELSAQAIRTRLAGIFPPVENSAWSNEATQRFRELASMKHVEARISKIIPNKSIVEVYLHHRRTSSMSLNDILADEGHALLTSKTRKKCIEDPHCIPKVKFLHLFPTFEEIEYWMVPSVEEQTSFIGTDITAEFFYPQYFTWAIDESEIDSIERKTKKTLRRKEKLVKYVDAKKLDRVVDLREIHMALYGEMYESFRDDLEEYEQQPAIVKKEDKSEDTSDHENLMNKLRRLHNSDSSQAPKIRENVFLDKKAMNSYINSDHLKLKNREFDAMADFYGSEFAEDFCSEMKKKTTTIEHLSRKDCLNNLSELEKYLSEEDEDSREQSIKSPNTSKLIDLDDTSHTSLRNTSTLKNDSSDLSMNQSSSGFTRYRRDCLSLLSDSSLSDMEQSIILDKPIKLNLHNTPVKKSNSICSDLIQLDVVLDTPILMPEIIGSSSAHKSKEKNAQPPAYIGFMDNVSDADDEDDSDHKLNPNALEFILKSSKLKSTNKKVNPSNVAQTQTDISKPFVPSSSNVPAEESIVLDAPSVSSSSDVPCPKVPVSNDSIPSDMDVSSSSDMVSEPLKSTCSEGVQTDHVTPKILVKKPPPGFGPVPMYSYPRPAMPGSKYTTYQPWSTADCLGINPQMGFPRPQNAVNVPVNNMGFSPQQFVSQVSSFYQCPPIVVFNYNPPPFVHPMQNQGFVQQPKMPQNEQNSAKPSG